jgi:hypothetical protein
VPDVLFESRRLLIDQIINTRPNLLKTCILQFANAAHLPLFLEQPVLSEILLIFFLKPLIRLQLVMKRSANLLRIRRRLWTCGFKRRLIIITTAVIRFGVRFRFALVCLFGAPACTSNRLLCTEKEDKVALRATA